MPGYRYHAFSEAPLHDYVPTRPKAGALSRLLTRVAIRLFWSAENEQVRQVFRAFAASAVIGDDFRVTARAWCTNPWSREHIQIGRGVVCRGLLRSERFHAGRIVIGDHVYLGDDTIISCAERVELGEYSMVAHGVQIFDNDSHPMDAADRERDLLIAVGRLQGERPHIERAPILIGARSWIGLHAIILKGVTIGPGSIVAAGSVVTTDVPAWSVAAGNPARVVKSLTQAVAA